MVPDGIESVIAFALLIAPGLTFNLLARRRRPNADVTVFEEISRTVLSSAAFTVAAAALLGIVSYLVFGLSALSLDVLPSHELHIVAAVVALTACGLAVVTDWILERRESGADIREVPAWFQAFRVDREEGHQTVVRVRMRDGTSWLGRVAHYSAGSDGDERDLVLSGRMSFRLPDGSTVDLDELWSRVVLSASNIAAIQVAYPPDDNPPAK